MYLYFTGIYARLRSTSNLKSASNSHIYDRFSLSQIDVQNLFVGALETGLFLKVKINFILTDKVLIHVCIILALLTVQ
jgi:hypothetical protein